MDIRLISQSLGELARFNEKGKVFLPNGVQQENLRQQQFILHALSKQVLADPAPGSRYRHRSTKEGLTVLFGIPSSANRLDDNDCDRVLCLSDSGSLQEHDHTFFNRMYQLEE